MLFYQAYVIINYYVHYFFARKNPDPRYQISDITKRFIDSKYPFKLKQDSNGTQWRELTLRQAVIRVEPDEYDRIENPLDPKFQDADGEYDRDFHRESTESVIEITNLNRHLGSWVIGLQANGEVFSNSSFSDWQPEDALAIFDHRI